MNCFTIKAHCVPMLANNLSVMQTRLAEGGERPIRIVSAPTGTGKTFGFVQQIKEHRRSVFFVVPTRALARNVEDTLKQQNLPVKVWDADQSVAARAKGVDPWSERLADLHRQGAPGGAGGMILATLEAFHGIVLGFPGRRAVTLLSPMTVLDNIDELVFDEAHLLNERAFGFLMGWATLISYNATLASAGRRPRLTLLSATHSRLRETLIDLNATTGIPAEWIELIEEEVIERDAGQWPQNTRPIHGDVTVSVHEEAATVEELLDLIPTLLQRHPGQVMVIHDSVARLDLNEALVEELRLAGGIEHEQVHVVSGHDRQGTTAGSGRYSSGPEVPDSARLIIGTSAIEVGISLPKVTALVTDPGHDPASLLQRIGRVARGPGDGEVHVVAGGRGVQQRVLDHILRLRTLDGEVSVQTFIAELGLLKDFNQKRAAELASAYFAMLRRQARHHGQAFEALFAYIEQEHGRRPVRRASLLNKVKGAIDHFTEDAPYHPELPAVQRWLKQIDATLRDLRGFSPTVSVRFHADDPGTEASPYDIGFVESYLGLPDYYDGEILCYRESRDRCMRVQAEPRLVTVVLPTGEQRIGPIRNTVELPRIYEQAARQALNGSDLPRAVRMPILDFIRCSGLAPLASTDADQIQVQQPGSQVL